ncbi:hypothetical protein NQ176_g6015 [Zarea fungicola]|uniref:Uncharacterized protein n=1 Tax=Zarea fungicola TaxID=93591 RepID=A0ACC1N6U3_9HYPO|nr:hypothetical protein NQ176_g6015 [Lecanicillium fungicola]
MGVSYENCGSHTVQQSEHGIWKAGFRCPDMVVTPLGGIGERRLYSEVEYGNYLLLSIGSASVLNPGLESVVTQYAILAEDDKSTSNSEKMYTASWASLNDVFHVVVRPDMYIAFVAQDITACEAHIRSVLRAAQ